MHTTHLTIASFAYCADGLFVLYLLCLQDFDRARQVYKAALQLVPHRSFTFAKLWIQYAYFELRQKDMTAAKKILGTAIGMCPKEKLFKAYIELRTKVCK